MITVTEFYNMTENLQQQEKMGRTDKFPMIYNLLIGEGYIINDIAFLPNFYMKRETSQVLSLKGLHQTSEFFHVAHDVLPRARTLSSIVFCSGVLGFIIYSTVKPNILFK